VDPNARPGAFTAAATEIECLFSIKCDGMEACVPMPQRISNRHARAQEPMMSRIVSDFSDDIAAVSAIAAVPTILDVVCRTTGMGFAAVARVTEDRWIACSVRDEIQFGLQQGGELKIETTICNEIRQSGQPVIIDHVAEDTQFRAHHTPAMYGFQSYISMPITLGDGSFFGTLCAIDPRPARVNNPAVIGMFKLFAELIAFHLDTHRRLLASDASLLSERKTAELREQFIAVLGHDLRNPVASIDAGIHLLRKQPIDAKGKEIVVRMQSSLRRMSRMIDDILDFARGRLGGGIEIQRRSGLPLQSMLEQVIGELRSTHPERQIVAEISDLAEVSSDPGRIGQLLSNLLANALTHGAPTGPIKVRAGIADDALQISVANDGKPISAEEMKDLFKPFFRAATKANQEGLGLGLYIASEIAKAHGGTLSASSTPDETRFTFRMPVR
jgi:signal transduction histidine kinase